ncbi:MAG: flagellar motor protein MotA [Deltaproteobacteria bacterium]|nr:flagellar motor protein MotA [Deltaproteobacteria bacterium]HCH63014.1 MotA/TolQ/ExbB proton channel family protein [Deltaproteobacteria bacterium]
MIADALGHFGLETVLVLFMLLTSVLLVGIALERAVAIGWMRMSVRSTQDTIQAAATASLIDARVQAKNIKGPMKAVFVAGLDRALGQVKGLPERAMARERKQVAASLKARTWILATAGALMPFVGLFGTVVGVMEAFFAIGETGQGGFAVVSVGISQALIATAVGIAVALEGVFLFNLVQAFASTLTRDISHAVDELGELIAFHSHTDGRG